MSGELGRKEYNRRRPSSINIVHSITLTLTDHNDAPHKHTHTYTHTLTHARTHTRAHTKSNQFKSSFIATKLIVTSTDTIGPQLWLAKGNPEGIE